MKANEKKAIEEHRKERIKTKKGNRKT